MSDEVIDPNSPRFKYRSGEKLNKTKSVDVNEDKQISPKPMDGAAKGVQRFKSVAPDEDDDKSSLNVTIPNSIKKKLSKNKSSQVQTKGALNNDGN